MSRTEFFKLNETEEEFVHEGAGGTVQEAHLENLDTTFRRVVIGTEGSEPQEIWYYGGEPGNTRDKEEDIERARKFHMGEDDGMEVVKID